MTDKIVIYTDGACRGNPGPGGWGAIIIENNIETELYGKETDILWSVKFLAVDNIPRHPTQIYEAFFEGLIILLVIFLIYKI